MEPAASHPSDPYNFEAAPTDVCTPTLVHKESVLLVITASTYMVLLNNYKPKKSILRKNPPETW
jgi:hypothetical protein